MIIIQVGNNGFGNQLYAFALGIVLEVIYGEKNIAYDVSQLTRYVRGRKMYNIKESAGIQIRAATLDEIRKATGMDNYRLPLFCLHRYRDDKEMISYVQKHWEKRSRNAHSILVEENSWDTDQHTLQVVEEKINAYPNAQYFYLAGYWQNISYFKGYEEQIRSRIHFNGKGSKCQSYLTLIKSTRSVSVHLRRGDFLEKDYAHCFCVCHRDYYIKAIDFVNSLDTEVQYYFFGDDIPYIKKTFSFLKNVTFVEGLKDYEDLFLMTQCNINIISNSTFSFWGGFLNCHENALVIAPRIQYLKKKDGRWKSFLMSVPEQWKVI